MRRSISILAAGLMALAAGRGANFGAITGTVFDAAGDSTPMAKVTVIEQGSGARRDTLSDEAGRFRVTGLAAGAYRIVASSVLRGTSEEEVALEEGQTADVPLALTISRAPSPLPRDRSDLTPGQQGGDIEGYGPYGTRGSTSFNSYGQRGQHNNYLLDGLDNNAHWVRGAALMPPAEAIASMNVSNGYIPAEYGHATGATLSLTSRSGSSAFHGSAFERFGNSALDARNFFDGAKAGLRQNWFGATVGGPAPSRGLFYFADFEILRDRHDLTVVSTVPTIAEKAGIFSGSEPIYDPATISPIGQNVFLRHPFTENRIPLTSEPLPAQRLLALYPDPNLPGAADNYRFDPTARRDQQRFDVRADQTISARHSAFVRLTHESSDAAAPWAFPGGFGSDLTQHADGDTVATNAWGATVSETFSVRPSLLNSFRAGVQGIDLHARAEDQGTYASTALGISGLGGNGSPLFVPTGYTALGAAGPVPFQVRSASGEIEDSVAWTNSRHAWKFGFQAIRRHLDGDAGPWNNRGTFFFSPDFTSQPGAATATGNSIASMMLGFPSEVRRDIQLAPYQLRGWELAGFAEDQLRVSSRLVVQAGLRYSLLPPLTEAGDHMVNFNFNDTAPALSQFANHGGVNGYGGLRYNGKALAPRFGFSWDLARDGSTVLRGGFSKAFDEGDYRAEGALARNAPYASRLDQVNGTFQVGPNLTAGLPGASASGPLTAFYAIQPQPFTPYTDQWDLFIQHRLRPQLVLESGLESSMGIHLYAGYDANQPYPGPTPSPTLRYPFEPYESRIDYLGMGGGSTYYGGVARLTGRLAPRLIGALSYTYGKAIDDAVAPDTSPQSRPAAPQDIYGPRHNRGLSPFDVAQRAALTVQYDLPRDLPKFAANWRLESVVIVQSGFPFTPELATNSLNNGGFQLPNRVGDGSLPAGQRSYLNWFNTKLGQAFTIPGLYQFGDSGFDILHGPWFADVSSQLSRVFALSDRWRVEPRIEAMNLLNRANFALPNAILGVGSSGVISHTITPARQMQLAVLVTW